MNILFPFLKLFSFFLKKKQAEPRIERIQDQIGKREAENQTRSKKERNNLKIMKNRFNILFRISLPTQYIIYI